MNTSVTVRIYIIFTILVALWCAGIIIAPVLKNSGYMGDANMVYTIFSHVCHQSDARSFHIEGEKFGVCIRCSAIYFGFLTGLLLIPLFGGLKRLSIPKPSMMVAVMIPMMMDVILNDTDLHTSTTITRMATGLLFGGVISWCVIPILLEACLQLMNSKKIQLFHPGVKSYVRKTQ